MTARVSRADLPWLAPVREGFEGECAALEAGGASHLVHRLAASRLSTRQARRLSRALLASDAIEAGTLAGFRLVILSGATLDLLEDPLRVAAARYGVGLEIQLAPYGQVLQEALDPNSITHRFQPDALLLAVDHRWLQLEGYQPGIPPQQRVERALATVSDVVRAMREHSGTPCILSLLPAPARPLFGSYEMRVEGTERALIQAYNAGLCALAADTGSYLLDTASLAEAIGTDQWFDDAQWVAYKLPFSSACLPAYADLLGRLLGAIRGKSRKCLVLDLDNTLWGGVIGDDGLEGIRVSPGSPSGEAHLAVQALARSLRDRGILLAVCSKNDDAVARAPFRDHPDMLLREADFAAFQANWVDKASNLEAIARKLNIGLDALVLLDDNPAEREQVRAALPMVAVPELPEDPSLFAWTLSVAGYFEAVAFSEEDRTRAQAYAADAQREDIKAGARDLGEYLRSLQMTASLRPFDRQGLQRIVQLINKTNQFNLTTRRYTEAEVDALMSDPAAFTLQVRLADRFGDLGMISVVICRQAHAGTWDIDTWLMSCRVLGRRVEECVLDHVVAEARRRGVQCLRGIYRPTSKNGMVADFYSRLGFNETEGEGSSRCWLLELARHVSPALLPIQVQVGLTGQA